MANIVINKTSYPIADRLEELNLRQARSLHKAGQLLNIRYPCRAGREEQIRKIAATVLSDLCGVPREIAEQTDPQSLLLFLGRCSARFFGYGHPATTGTAHDADPDVDPDVDPDITPDVGPDAKECRRRDDRYAGHPGESKNDSKEEEDESRKDEPCSQTESVRQIARDKPAEAERQNDSQEDSFCWQGERLRFPEPGIDINGAAMPMHNLTAVEFCEATDLYLSDALEYAPLIAALLCRPGAERYSERKCRQRALSMQTLPMQVVLRLFGVLNHTHRYLRQVFPHCYASRSKLRPPAREDETAAHAIPFTWNDMLLEAAGFRPEALRAAEQMNLYDFMRLLNAKGKRRAVRPI